MKQFLENLGLFISSFIDSIIIAIFRPFWKYILRYFTGRSELERIVFDTNTSNYSKDLRIKKSLLLSRTLSHVLDSPFDDLNRVIDETAKKKYAPPKFSFKSKDETGFSLFRQKLLLRVQQIIAYETLKQNFEAERSEFYDSENLVHEEKLLHLWSLLNPDVELASRVSDQWANELGFQGSDPATDFRGMGLLGLNQLIFVSTHFNAQIRHRMQQSRHPSKGYPFAIVGISMTSLVRDLVRFDVLKKYFSLIGPDGLVPKMEDVHKIYCKVFFLFDKFWYESNPATIMEYNSLRTKFYQNLCAQLNDEDGAMKFAFMMIEN